MTRVSFPSSMGESAGFLEAPSGEGRGPAVVVIHEWWGANEQIVKTARRWADAGFLALAPDLYHGKVIPIGQADAADAAMKGLDFGKAVQELAGAVQFLRDHPRCNGKVVVTGYCMGGALTLATAVNVRGLACAVAWYGTPGDLDWSMVDAPVQAHFATHDDWASVAAGKQIQAGVKSMELHVYEAQHAFCNDQRPDVYNPEAAALSWERALAFAKAHTA